MEKKKIQELLETLDSRNIWYLDATTYNEVECEPELPDDLNGIFERLEDIAEAKLAALKLPQEMFFDGFVNEGMWLATFCDAYGRTHTEIPM
ncbi:hypothetical protein [Limosilactobacillus mucosae]|uniref:Uncharacterized protein n=1 Tax=Limosilactobacillus mucosae TaxID=97478 RepID=A0AAJ1HM63_LIMMU|nr:hypothetical protein [Limosilactobacillus mucosae]MDC2826958.1 hypothetical protein [Limosilactobacillus mucosae]MDC2834673.1 hypothetical protein [Limosilactobacillus mucosae]